MTDIASNTLPTQDLLAYDREHIWHPYSSSPSQQPMYAVDSAEGVHLTLTSGEKVIDGMSSWWSVIHGYNHPELNAALTSQLNRVAHVMFGGLTHEPAVTLAKSLVELTPKGLEKVFFSDSGSVAVEVAIKMAIQYWQSTGNPKKSKLMSLRRGYHGDTFAAMAVCDPVTGMHHLFKSVLPEQIFTESPRCAFDAPWNEHDLDDFEKQIKTHHQDLAAVILEPIVQGTGGMNFYSPRFLEGVRALCDDYNVLLIADEIATGFGRTGKLFACEHADISPDIMCLGKSITAGYMSFAATLCQSKIAAGICEGEAGVFMHGPTFMGNPLACSVANANIALLQNSNWQQKVTHIEKQLKQHLKQFETLECVAGVRALGAIGVIEMKTAVDLNQYQPEFVKQGIWLRPFGKLIYTMPPYVISDADLAKLMSATFNVIKRLNP